MSRSTQTNEVGRLATLMPAFASLGDGQPLALLEVGASAGLCLYPDRYDYDWQPVGRLTGSGGPELRCDVAGAMPVPAAPLRVGWRGGIDLNQPRMESITRSFVGVDHGVDIAGSWPVTSHHGSSPM